MSNVFTSLRHSCGTCLSLTLLLVCSLTFRALAQVSVTATGGTTGPTAYTTVKSAFDAINSGVHTGAITVTVSSNTTETATAVLNASGNASASYTSVLLKPGTGTTPVVSGAISAGPIIKLNGANNVTINGSNNGTTTRDLTISNTSTTTPQVVHIGSVGTTPVAGDTLKNCTIINGANTSTAVIVSDAAAAGGAGYFNNITIRNNSVQRAYIGMYLITAIATNNGINTLVADNDLSTSGANAIRLCGIYVQGLSGATVANNMVGNFEQASGEYDRAIWLATGTGNTTVSGNTVTGLNYSGTAGYAPIGINISPGITNANILVTGNNVNNLTSASSGTTIGIYFFSAASGVTIQKNSISNITNTNASGFGSAGIYLTGSLTASNTSVVNNFVWDVASVGFNGFTAADNGNGIVIDGGGGYDINFNTVKLSANPTLTGGNRGAAMLVTSNVTAAGSINMRNNIFANLQTVGNGNSRFAFVSTAANTVFNTRNYNNYYSTSTNLACAGTNATICNTVAQIQSQFGGNANSVSILPVFAGANDLHLPAAGNAALNNLGLSIAGITDDIDGDPRTATPDMGADEFGNCQTVTITGQPASAVICANGSATFTGAATNSTLYQWQVNTGSGFTNITNGGVYGGATTPSLSITGATATMNGYTYQLLASSGNGCPQVPTGTATLTVNPVPATTVTPSGSTSFCTGGSVTLAAPVATGVTYQWQNNGTNIGSATGSSYTATTSGSYGVVITNTATGCSATSAPVTVTVGAGPAAVITPASSVSICQGANTTLSAGNSSGVTYQWLLNGTAIPNATASTYTTGTGGNYTVVVSTSPTCSTTSPVTAVNINPLPAAVITPNGSTSVCQGSSVQLSATLGSNYTYQWQLNGNNITTNGTGVNYTANAAGSYTVRITNTSTTCQNTSAPVAITLVPLPSPSIAPVGSLTICEGDSVQLNTPAGTGLSYQWRRNGTDITGAVNSSYKAASAGTYAVTVTNANGCAGTSAGTIVTVNPSPVSEITYSAPLTFCEGAGVVLNATPNANSLYQWHQNGLPIGGASQTVFIVNKSGIYTVLVTNNFNCARMSLPVNVIVNPLPHPVITQNNGVLSTGPYATYQWYRNNQTIGGATSQTLILSQNGAYSVKVTDFNGCINMSDIFFINSLGVGNTPLQADILLFPNPATSYVTVENKSTLQVTGLTILNSLGAVVLRQELSGRATTVYVGGLPAGIYTARIQTDKGTIIRKVEILK